MKNIILSDIHSNADALLAVIKEIVEKEYPISRLLIAGDIVGYGASPNECCNIVRFLIYGRKAVDLKKIRESVIQSCLNPHQQHDQFNTLIALEKKGLAIGGNHDRETAGESSLTGEMNPIASAAVDWTKRVLTKENLNFLKSLSLRMKFDKEQFEIVHSTPSCPRSYEYVRNAGALNYTSLWSKVTFGGHTHRPSAYIYTREIRTVNASVLVPADNYDMRLMRIEKESTDRVESFVINTNNDWKYYINVGSVGQPRDGNSHACYVVYDSTAKHLSFKRVPYNTEAASKKILEAKLPKELAERISKGV